MYHRDQCPLHVSETQACKNCTCAEHEKGHCALTEEEEEKCNSPDECSCEEHAAGWCALKPGKSCSGSESEGSKSAVHAGPFCDSEHCTCHDHSLSYCAMVDGPVLDYYEDKGVCPHIQPNLPADKDGECPDIPSGSESESENAAAPCPCECEDDDAASESEAEAKPAGPAFCDIEACTCYDHSMGHCAIPKGPVLDYYENHESKCPPGIKKGVFAALETGLCPEPEAKPAKAPAPCTKKCSKAEKAGKKKEAEAKCTCDDHAKGWCAQTPEQEKKCEKKAEAKKERKAKKAKKPLSNATRLAPGCGKDTDCKFDRICIKGLCVFNAPPPQPTPPPAPQGAGGEAAAAGDDCTCNAAALKLCTMPEGASCPKGESGGESGTSGESGSTPGAPEPPPTGVCSCKDAAAGYCDLAPGTKCGAAGSEGSKSSHHPTNFTKWVAILKRIEEKIAKKSTGPVMPTGPKTLILSSKL